MHTCSNGRALTTCDITAATSEILSRVGVADDPKMTLQGDATPVPPENHVCKAKILPDDHAEECGGLSEDKAEKEDAPCDTQPSQLKEASKESVVVKQTLWVKLSKMGILYALASGIITAVQRLPTKLLVHLNPVQVLSYAAVLSCLMSIAHALCKKQSLLPVRSELPYLIPRILGGAIGQPLMYSALKYIPLGDVAAITAAQTPSVALFACILYREGCNALQGVAIVLVFFGVMLISRPSFLFDEETSEGISTSDRITGTLLTIGYTLLAVVNSLVSRKLQTTPSCVTTGYVSLGIFVLGMIYLTAIGDLSTELSVSDFALIAVTGVTFSVALELLVIAFRLEHAGLVTLALNIQIAGSYVLQITALGRYPTWTSVLGTVLIFCSVVVVVSHKLISDGKCDWFGRMAKKTRRFHQVPASNGPVSNNSVV